MPVRNIPACVLLLLHCFLFAGLVFYVDVLAQNDVGQYWARPQIPKMNPDERNDCAGCAT
jgi:hypothetical protein